MCIKRRVSAWSFRLMEEEKKSSSSYFITLTYHNNNLTYTENGLATLVKRDVQLFMKRLRKQNDEKLKYYLCGEYGSDTERPHYHVILFNAKLETIQKAWNLGQIHYGTITEASVGYTLKYISKPSKIPYHDRDDRQKEFPLMSKGIGKRYMTENMIKWHKADLENRMYCNIKDGKKICMPRYYKDKIYNQDERGILKSVHTKRLQEYLIELAYSPDINKLMHTHKENVKAFKDKIHYQKTFRNKI